MNKILPILLIGILIISSIEATVAQDNKETKAKKIIFI